MIEAIQSTTLTVEHPHWGSIYVLNRHRHDQTEFVASRTIVLQHGATFGCGAFEQRFDGMSWMDFLAACGFDVYCLDLPGYGRSTRPTQMDQPAADNPPFMRTPDAADCLDTVVEMVCNRRQLEQVCLIGWSWGTVISSYYTVANPNKVERLVLYAPVWDRQRAGPSSTYVPGKLGAYRTVAREAAQARRQSGLPEHLKGVIMPPDWFDQWWQATAACDPAGDGESIRAPNGVVQDAIEYWNVGKSRYVPSAISAPVLLVVGELDKDTPPSMAHALFDQFTQASHKQLAVIGGGTHALLMERNRLQLFSVVQQFLDSQFQIS